MLPSGMLKNSIIAPIESKALHCGFFPSDLRATGVDVFTVVGQGDRAVNDAFVYVVI